MPISLNDLAKPIDWHDTKYWPMLGDLQGNILKGHGRDHTINSFLRFGADIAKVKQGLRAIGAQVTSALRQLNEADAFQLFERPGGSGVFFFLTAEGYEKLGKAAPGDPAFKARMETRPLGDPDPGTWVDHLKPGIHALMIVADDDVTKVGNFNAEISRALVAADITVLGVDAGHAIRSEASPNEPKGRGIEHFGYVDGRSQPLMLAQEVSKEETKLGGIDQWNPGFGPGKVALVADPHGLTAESYGSYLIYRKLEQNVAGFKARETALALRLGLVGDDDERAGAMVVGRFEDGTPLIKSKKATDPSPTPNNFRYDDDPDGLKCPIHAHVRKINPRQLGADDGAEQRSHLMPRRGIPFGNPERDFEDETTFPTGGVGLIFMAYNQDISRQFEVSQRFWANSETFPGNADAIDLIIGQSATGHTATWHPTYGESGGEVSDFPFEAFVKMLGGAYFFAPSIGFLKTLN